MQLNKDTVLCMSLAARPGNFGTVFHNFLYQQLNLNYIYKSFTTENLADAVAGIKALGIRGCAISMPFKEVVIPLLDELDFSASCIGAVNTIVNDQGKLKGFNTDYTAIKEMLVHHEVLPSMSVAVMGSGGMAKAVVRALFDLGFKNTTVFSRNETTGKALAHHHHFEWKKQGQESETHAEVLINASPLGMSPSPLTEIPFSPKSIQLAKIIFDVVAIPAKTGLLIEAEKLKKRTISGQDITTIQAREQFSLYTGLKPPPHLVTQAAHLARQ